MNSLDDNKKMFRSLLPEQGIIPTINALKKSLHDNCEIFKTLILIESQIREVQRRQLQGTVDFEKTQLIENGTRKKLLDLIDQINEKDTIKHNKKTDSSPVLANSIGIEVQIEGKKKFHALIEKGESLPVSSGELVFHIDEIQFSVKFNFYTGNTKTGELLRNIGAFEFAYFDDYSSMIDRSSPIRLSMQIDFEGKITVIGVQDRGNNSILREDMISYAELKRPE